MARGQRAAQKIKGLMEDLPAQGKEARESAKAIISKFHQTLGDNLMEAEATLRELAFGIWTEEYVKAGDTIERRVYQEKPDVRALELYIKLFTGEPKKIVENIHALEGSTQKTLDDLIKVRATEAASYWDKRPEPPRALQSGTGGAGVAPAIEQIQESTEYVEGEFELVDHSGVIARLQDE